MCHDSGGLGLRNLSTRARGLDVQLQAFTASFMNDSAVRFLLNCSCCVATAQPLLVNFPQGVKMISNDAGSSSNPSLQAEMPLIRYDKFKLRTLTLQRLENFGQVAIRWYFSFVKRLRTHQMTRSLTHVVIDTLWFRSPSTAVSRASQSIQSG